MNHIITHDGTKFNLDQRMATLKNGQELTFEFVMDMASMIHQLRHYEIFLRMEEEINRVPQIQLWKEPQ
jgi:hypothetical protein